MPTVPKSSRDRWDRAMRRSRRRVGLIARADVIAAIAGVIAGGLGVIAAILTLLEHVS